MIDYRIFLERAFRVHLSKDDEIEYIYAPYIPVSNLSNSDNNMALLLGHWMHTSPWRSRNPLNNEFINNSTGDNNEE